MKHRSRRDPRTPWGWARRTQRDESRWASMWVVPMGFAIGAVILHDLVMLVPISFADLTAAGIPYSASTSAGVLTTIAGSMMTVTGVIFSVLTLTVQQAGSAVSPRVVRTFYRDKVPKYSLGFFVGTFTFSLMMIAEVDAPQISLGVYLAVGLVLVSVGTFLFMLNHVGQRLRSAAMLARVSEAIQESSRRSYLPAGSRSDCEPFHDAEAVTQVVQAGRSGVVIAINWPGLQRLAARRSAPLRVLIGLGDPIWPGDALVESSTPLTRLDQVRVLNQIAVGEERTIDHDPAFGMRILVDAAIKALSPAINDPTTAVVALDGLADALTELGQRDLGGQRSRWLIGPETSWSALVELALVEITYFGASSFQVTRRIAAMLEDLRKDLPQACHPALAERQAELVRRVRQAHPDLADVGFALTPDRQGISATAVQPAGAATLAD